MEIIEKIIENYLEVKRFNPLVHNITNYVTVNDCANVQLAIGGSPIMSNEIEDVLEITKICSALVINIGTLNKRTIEAMHCACKLANEAQIPIVLDPVGCGASTLRSSTTLSLLEKHQFAAIRGNLSEISYIAGVGGNTRGVDSNEEDLKNDAEKIAVFVAKKYHCAVGITGKVDVISDGTQIYRGMNGHLMMKQVTGTGCMISALIGVFLGAKVSGFMALCSAISLMGIAGEMTYERVGTQGTGSLRVGIIDCISTICPEDIRKRINIDEKKY